MNRGPGRRAHGVTGKCMGKGCTVFTQPVQVRQRTDFFVPGCLQLLGRKLVDCSLDMGPLRFVRGSHKYGNLEGLSISNESARFFDNFIQGEGLEVVQVPNITAGSCSIHLGWTIHGAPANGSNKIREAMTANYFPDGARITDMSRSPDGLRFVGGYLPGQLANGPMNPIVYAEEDA